MLSTIGQTSTQLPGNSGRNGAIPGTADRAAGLDGEIRRDTIQLNDWVTCVSANTPKGKAEIQSLSASISGAKEQIARIQAERSAERGSGATTHAAQMDAAVPTGSDQSPNARFWLQSAHVATRAGVLLNTWA